MYDIFRGLLGIAVLLGIAYLLSRDRKNVNFRQVGIGVLLQIVLAVFILKVPGVSDVFDIIARIFRKVLSFSNDGAKFLFGPTLVEDPSFGAIFAFQVIPTIVFFAALSSFLYYIGFLQKVIQGMAWVMKRLMNLSGPESLAAAANVFIGQTEAPLVVKPYLENFTRSEIMCLMTGGMATIAGSVFAAYIGYLGGSDIVQQEYFAKHLLTASIISAPAAIVAAKILLPEANPAVLDEGMRMQSSSATNALDAISQGTVDGLKLAVNVGAILLVFTAFVAMGNYLISQSLGEWVGLNGWAASMSDGAFQEFNLQFILGLIFAPIAWLIGVTDGDLMQVGQLLGLKTTLNEFFAYAELQGVKDQLSDKSLIITTYALCGFSNFASIGIQIGGISAIAPGQRKNLVQLGILALIGGTIACLLTAAVAGMLF